MLTVEQVKKNHPEYKALIQAVVDGINIEQIPNINKYGIDGGYGIFIYYHDTIPFFKKNRKSILRLTEYFADVLGEGSELEMIQSFNCFTDKRNRKPFYTISEIAKALYTGKGADIDQIYNGMSWFAAEEVCRWFEEEED